MSSSADGRLETTSTAGRGSLSAHAASTAIATTWLKRSDGTFTPEKTILAALARVKLGGVVFSIATSSAATRAARM
jgi:hypothetical protein